MSDFLRTDNRFLLPPYRPDSEVRLIPSSADGQLLSPDWTDELVLVEVHPETATREGTLASLIPVLDHLAALGVNGIWLTPIYEKGPGGNGYGNQGPHTLEPAVTGCTDINEGWQRVRAFVEEAHRRNIRVLLDLITWGTMKNSALQEAHPDWFRGEAWGGSAFDWKNADFCEWYIDTCVRNILVTGADGYRADCEPMFAGHRIFGEIRRRLLKHGRKVLLIAEESSERGGAYDFEQDGITNWIGWSRGEQYQHPKAYFLEGWNIVDCVTSGKLHGSAASQRDGTSGRDKYYTYCISNHDFQRSLVNGNRLVMGYPAIFAPYIPLWYLGSEFGMRAENQVIYFVPVDWSLLEREENRAFCEDIARYLRIRRMYPDIFAYWPINHRETNIRAVDADTELPSYERYTENRRIFVIPNSSDCAKTYTVRANASEDSCILTDLLSGQPLPFTCMGNTITFRTGVESGKIGVFLLEATAE